MTWFSIDTLAKVGIPLLTFALGAAFTFFSRFSEQSAVEYSGHVEQLVRLTREWFDELTDLSLTIQFSKNDLEVKRATATYLQKRIFLPEILYHLQYLQSSGRNGRFSQVIQEFLAVVTATRDHEDGERLNLFSPEFDSTARLDVLSLKVRNISSLAGEILALERRPFERTLRNVIARVRNSKQARIEDAELYELCLPPETARQYVLEARARRARRSQLD